MSDADKLAEANQQLKERQIRSFPIPDNWLAQRFLVQSEISEQQQTTLIQYFSTSDVKMEDYTWA
eukprot:9084582-Prorocentrum_lima.AAC.1